EEDVGALGEAASVGVRDQLVPHVERVLVALRLLLGGERLAFRKQLVLRLAMDRLGTARHRRLCRGGGLAAERRKRRQAGGGAARLDAADETLEVVLLVLTERFVGHAAASTRSETKPGSGAAGPESGAKAGPKIRS